MRVSDARLASGLRCFQVLGLKRPSVSHVIKPSLLLHIYAQGIPLLLYMIYYEFYYLINVRFKRPFSTKNVFQPLTQEFVYFRRSGYRRSCPKYRKDSTGNKVLDRKSVV